MSIIHDALKKVQKDAPQGTPTPIPIPAAPVSAAVTPVKKQPKPSPVIPSAPQTLKSNSLFKHLGVVLMILLGLVVVALLGLLFKLAIATTEPGINNAHVTVPTTTKETTPVPASAPAVVEPSTELFKIEGIMDRDGKKVALINGRIYEEGLSINGMTILEITLDHVAFDDKGQRRLIPTTP